MQDTQVRNKVSYRETLTGAVNQKHGEYQTTNPLESGYPDSDDDVYDKEEDKDYCPVICLTKEEKKALRQRWRQSLIIKLWGRKVGYNYLQKKLQSMWRLKAFMDLVALENDYFLVRFYSKDDYEFARDEGPWTILDHYLVVKEWAPDFDPLTDKTEKLIVWVRFPCLPIEYFDYAFLKKVGEKIGKPIRADHNTGTAARGRFARLCVEVDITKPLLTMFKLRKRIRHIEYEGIHLVCFKCGIVGHKMDECPTNRSESCQQECHAAGEDTELSVNDEVRSKLVQIRKEGPDGYQGKETFGPWMLAQKKEGKYHRRNQGKYLEKGIQGNKEGRYSTANNMNNDEELIVKSRYNALYGLEEVDNGNDNPGDVEPNRNKRDHNTEVQKKGYKIKEKNGRDKSPLPDLNEVNDTQEMGREINHIAEKENNSRQRKGNHAEKPKQAAAESEHVVIRGSERGKNIVRTVVVELENVMEAEADMDTDEHHQDPPKEDDQGDALMDEFDDNDGDVDLQRGLSPGGGTVA